MFKWIVLSFFIIISVPAFSEQQSSNKTEDPELIFSEAVSLSSEGKYDEAIQKYQYLLTNQYKDKYIYYSLLETYSLKIRNLQMNLGEEDMTNLFNDEMNYSKDALNVYTNDLKLLYYYADSVRNLGMASEYVDALHKILEIDSMDIFANYYLADYFYVNKQYEQAAYFFQKVIASPEDNVEFNLMAVYRSYYSLGIISLFNGDYQFALQFLEKAKGIYSRDYELLKTLALTYAGVLEYGKAIENFELIPENYLTDDILDTYYGVLFAGNNTSLAKIIKKKHEKSAFLIAIDFYQKKHYKDSIKELDLSVSEKKNLDYYTLYLYFLNYKSIGDHEKTTEEAFFLGNKAKEAGKIDLAISYYKILQGNAKATPSVYWLIGSLYDDKNDYANAVSYYNKYLKDPNSGEYRVQALIRLSDMYYRQKNFDSAGRMLSKAKEAAVKNSDQFQVYFYSGLIQFENKNYSNAVAEFDEALKANIKEPRLYFFLGTSYFELNEREKAEKILEQGIKFESRNAEMNNLLAYIYALEKVKFDEALRLVNLALIMQPENPAYLDTLGWIYYQKGDYGKSIEVFNHLIDQLPRIEKQDGLDEIYYHIGMILEKTGNNDEAKSYFLKGLEINPANELIKNSIK